MMVVGEGEGGLQIQPTVGARPRAPEGRTSKRGCGRRKAAWRGSSLGSRGEWPGWRRLQTSGFLSGDTVRDGSMVKVGSGQVAWV